MASPVDEDPLDVIEAFEGDADFDGDLRGEGDLPWSLWYSILPTVFLL